MLLVSACLVGQSCRYDGKSKCNERVVTYLHDKAYMTFCPEVAGGLTIPRAASELQPDGVTVLSKAGEDVTAAFTLGAEMTVALARQSGASCIILKEGSPSCGVHRIYDGSFSGRAVEGQGLTAKRLMEAGFKVFSDEEEWL